MTGIRQAGWWRPAYYAVIGLSVGLAAVVCFAAFAVIGQIRTTQTDRLSQAETNDQTLTIIRDCTQTTGKCYKRGQRQTAAILNSAQRIIILSAACSADVSASQAVDDRIAAITDCVTARLARTHKKP